VGVKEIPRQDGKKDIIYYSVTPPAERKGRVEEKRYEYRKSWEVPEKVIIDRR